MIKIAVLNVPEFESLVQDAKSQGLPVSSTEQGDYSIICSEVPIEFNRNRLKLRPAIWYGLFTGGLQGTIERFDRDVVRIAPIV
jgi:hypothetical protein